MHSRILDKVIATNHCLYVMLIVTITMPVLGKHNEYAQNLQPSYNNDEQMVTIAILAKDKAHTLPLYLKCIEKQTWPASKTYLYVRTNNNNDHTAQILRKWLGKVGRRYKGVYFNDANVATNVQQYKQHQWNKTRFKVLGKIRQDSLNWAKKRGAHYFVADCDNFIQPTTIEDLVATGLPIIAPLLRTAGKAGIQRFNYYAQANFYAAIGKNDYAAPSPLYEKIFSKEVVGPVPVPLVHCTYLVRNEVLPHVTYVDDTDRYEFIIFSSSARKAGIQQYIDNRQLYGRFTYAETVATFAKEPWFHEFEAVLDNE